MTLQAGMQKLRFAHSTLPPKGRWGRVLRWALMPLVLTALLFSDGPTAFAAGGIVMKQISVGFSGYYSKSDWIPVTVTLANPSGAQEATLVVPLSSPVGANRLAYGQLKWPVWLPAHTSTTKQILLPGSIVGSATLSCEVNGAVVASGEVAGNALGNVALVAVLGDKAQAAQSLTGSEDGATGEPVLPVAMTSQNFPTAVDALSGLTALVATPSSLAALSARQSSAVQSWVHMGGLLVVTGTGAAATAWNSELPITTAPQQSVAGDGLGAFVGEPSTHLPTLTVRADTKSLQPNATVWAQTGEVPLIAELSVGRGSIVQTSFSPSEPSLLAWSGNASMWTTVFKMGSAQSLSAMPDYLSQRGIFSLASASDVLAPLRVPSLKFWATLFAVYALIVGPVLFLLLRRFKFQTAAWVILPVFSVLVTMGIYVFGASQRPNGLLTEATGVLDLVGDGTGQAYGIRAFTSPRVTSLSVHTQQPMLGLALVDRNNPVSEEESVTTSGHTSVSFSHVARWGVRYAYLAGAVHHQGELQADLMDTSGRLFGTLENNTPYHLHDVAVCWDNRVFELGDLRPGATVALDQPDLQQLNTDNWLSAYSTYNRDITRSIGRTLGTLAGNEQLLNSGIGLRTALIVATTSDETPALGAIQTREPIASSQNLAMTLVRQFANVDVVGSVGEAPS